MRVALDAALSAWAVAALGFTGVLLFRLLRARRRRRAAVPPAVGEVLLLRPVEAPTPAELENLAAPVPGVRQVVISPFRPPLPEHVEWLPWEPVAPNRKVSHLAAGLARFGPREVVLAADADVRVTPELVAALVAGVRGGAALCTAAPRVEASGPGGLALSGVLDHTPLSFAALDLMAVGARAVCGKAIALGPAAQAELPRLTRVVGEDLELALRLRAAGERVELADAFAEVRPGRVAFAATLERMTRWMQVLRAHRPGLYPTVPLFTAPTLLLTAAAALSRAPVALGLAGALVLARVALSVALKRSPRAGWAWALGEATLLAAFARSLARRTVVWRGRRFRLDAHGVME